MSCVDQCNFGRVCTPKATDAPAQDRRTCIKYAGTDTQRCVLATNSSRASLHPSISPPLGHAKHFLGPPPVPVLANAGSLSRVHATFLRRPRLPRWAGGASGRAALGVEHPRSTEKRENSVGRASPPQAHTKHSLGLRRSPLSASE